MCICKQIKIGGIKKIFVGLFQEFVDSRKRFGSSMKYFINSINLTLALGSWGEIKDYIFIKHFGRPLK